MYIRGMEYLIKNRPKPAVLVILDGWGIAPPSADNPITLAQTPNFDKLVASYPAMLLRSLGQRLSSAAGHFTIGAGRDWRQPALLDKTTIKISLSQTISQAGLKQLLVAETEKHIYLNYFFKGKEENKLSGQETKIIASPLVSSYESEPAMSARKITDEAISGIKDNQFDFIAVNFANPDVLSRTGNKAATIKAIEIVDKCLGRLAKAVLRKEDILLIIADHGRAEDLADFELANPVPFLIVGNQWEGRNAGRVNVLNGDLSLLEPIGELIDAAPTILKIMGLAQPAEMKGRPLI